MGASGFVTLASHFTDRTVATYDPRGVERSTKADDTAQSTPEDHGDDLHAVIGALGGGPVDLFASSGGAVNALALVARHPEDVHLLVAHEPPAAGVLPDRDAAFAAIRDMRDTYQRDGAGPAMVRFITLVGYDGEIPADFADQQFPDPAMFGMPGEDDGSRNDPLFGQNLITCTHYEPDFDALKAASTRLVIARRRGVRIDAGRACRRRDRRSDSARRPSAFPSDHGGFLGGEYGQTGKPDEFAAKLREVLAAQPVGV